MGRKIPIFGSREYQGALEYFGFTIGSRGASSHVKAKPPPHIKIKPGQRDFVMLQLGQKEFYDPGHRSQLVREITSFGFPKDEVIMALRGEFKRLKKLSKSREKKD